MGQNSSSERARPHSGRSGHAVGSHTAEGTVVPRVKGGAQHGLLEGKRLPGISWLHSGAQCSGTLRDKEEPEGAHACSPGTWWPQGTEYLNLESGMGAWRTQQLRYKQD